MNPSLKIPLLIAGLIVGGAWLWTMSDWTPFSWPTPANQEIEIPPVNPEQDHILGHLQADLFIIEYCDTRSPYCEEFHQTVNRLLQTWGTQGRITRVFRPTPALNENSILEAQSLECVAAEAEAEVFWRYLNWLYLTAPPLEETARTESDLLDLAEGADADRETVANCLATERFLTVGQDHLQTVVSYGAKYVPYIILKTHPFDDQKQIALKEIADRSTARINFQPAIGQVILEGSLEQKHFTEILNILLK